MLVLGWSVFPLVLLYWLENGIVGGFNVAKLLLAQPREPAYWAGKLFLYWNYWNRVKNGEYQRASLNALMGQPYGRVLVLHFTVLFGGSIVMAFGSPLLALVVLVVIKTAADVHAHTAERRRFAALPSS